MMTDKKTKKKLKKDIKWYTYVDAELDQKLQGFMKDNDITNQAMIIRKSVQSYLNYVDLINQNIVKETSYECKEIDKIITKAIRDYKTTFGFYEELKQHLSPLKMGILLMEDQNSLSKELKRNLKNIKKAVLELERSIKKRFEEPHPLRFETKFDILHIEDNELDRMTIKSYFEKKGCAINSVETTEEALEILKIATPKVILLDLNLKTSQIQGDEFSQFLKSKSEYKSIPIVMMTAFISKTKTHEFLQYTEADDIIIKPINKLADLDIIIDYI
ncbi:MAG: response regulator [Candidatus Lokiarchaeota archaeon]|nr:response regulator [Candidatus Lokiarchaeota archaeon]